MTHPDGGSGTSPTGPAGPSPRDVANADAFTSLCDTFIAAQIRRGFRPDQLDRDGRLVVTR